jgi:beta-carotene ketolase (CrtO type)
MYAALRVYPESWSTLIKSRGVELQDGTCLPADVVLSTIDVKRVFALLDSETAPSSMARAAERAHTGYYNVGEMKLDVALDSPPHLPGLIPEHTGSLYYLQHKSNHYSESLKQIFSGRFPASIPMMAAVPSIEDPTLAPPGKAVLWLSAFVPARWEDGTTWPNANTRVAEAMLDSFERFAPGTRSKIIGMQITGPAEWEARTGNPAGNPNHLDMTVDQLFTLRPDPLISDYSTPISGLYLSGAGTHPGGGVHGVPGFLTAQRVLTTERARG